MCGRTGLSLNKDQIQCACSYKVKTDNKYVKPEWLPEYNDGKEYIPSYNITPTDVTPVLISASQYKHAAKTERVLKPMVWGIIPPWHKADDKNHNLSTNNCRIENIKNSKLYSPILLNGGRCVIVVEGFYEWLTTFKTKTRQPYYIYTKQDGNVMIDEPATWNNSFNELDGWSGVKLLHIAGLYYVWQHNDKIIYSYSVITMESNSTLNWLHHRMPAVLDDEEKISAWLDVENVNADKALAYLKPVKMLMWHQLSTEVNNSRNKSENCNRRLKIENKLSQKSLKDFFTKVDKKKCNDKSNYLSKRKCNDNDDYLNKKKCNDEEDDYLNRNIRKT